MKVLSINPKETYDWLLNVHYAKRIPQIIKAFGLYDDDKLVGVITYGIPPITKFVYGGLWQRIFGNSFRVKQTLSFRQSQKTKQVN